MANPSTFSWAEPTTNTDGSAIQASEITAYRVGIRTAAGTVGTYPTVVPVTGATTLSAAVPSLASGSYAAAVQVVGPINSAYSPEVTFSIAPTPSPPPNFSIA